MTIFELFRQLSNSNAVLLGAIDCLEAGTLPQKEAHQLAESVWRAILPAVPAGRKHSKDSFWGQASQKMVWRSLCGFKQEANTKWLADNIHRINKPVIAVPCAYVAPQVRTGK